MSAWCQHQNANYTGIDSGHLVGSRIGFKGEEGLGNGLKAIFTLEYYISPDEKHWRWCGPNHWCWRFQFG